MSSPSSCSPLSDESLPTVYSSAPRLRRSTRLRQSHLLRCQPAPLCQTSHLLTSSFPQNSALITLTSLSRDLYKQNVHRLYRPVAPHKGNAEMFYQELFEPFDGIGIDIKGYKQQWKRFAGKVEGGRGPKTRLGPHDFRPGQSLFNEDAIYQTNRAARQLEPLGERVLAAIPEVCDEDDPFWRPWWSLRGNGLFLWQEGVKAEILRY
ncbi:hypothetical protein B9479_006365 [Cryptococcus floricola]|uniref:Uncharacterized protein n=1 Tax=Cryptococcus floricola TaxID=2591691 RepID=A0A5D3ANN3_9TREE|nr:hypothetical protein B9479_006365 [Cryptococcus floricola]